MNPCTLALDASRPEACLCLMDQEGILGETMLAAGQHSRQLTAAIMQLLDQHSAAPLTHLAYVAGPGSFTGLRIAAATLNGLNTAWHLPVIHLSSLQVSAASCDDCADVWVVEDARAGEYFIGRYQDMRMTCHDACVSASCLPEISAYTGSQSLPQVLVAGNYYPPSCSRGTAIRRLLRCVEGEVKAFAEPNYLQRSQAERMWVST